MNDPIVEKMTISWKMLYAFCRVQNVGCCFNLLKISKLVYVPNWKPQLNKKLKNCLPYSDEGWYVV